MTEEERKSLLEWEFILKNICDFVQVGRINGIRFEVYSNEQGHNRPHLHVSTADANMSIAIDNGRYLGMQWENFSCTKENGTKMD